jgi:hypothetical protein
MTRTALLLAATAVTLLAIVASGCGSSDSADEGVASLDSGAAASDGGSTTPQQTDEDPQEAALKWARCMRENGVDVPDPQVDSNGRVTVRPGKGNFRPGQGRDEKFQAATKKCGTPFGNAGPPQLSEAERQELQETMLKFAKCMREHGVDMPDPDFSGGGGAFRIGPGRGGVDPDDPDFKAAEEACQPILQDLPGRFERRGRAAGGGDT